MCRKLISLIFLKYKKIILGIIFYLNNCNRHSFTNTKRLDKEFFEREKILQYKKFMLINREKISFAGKKGRN